jgi:cytochrome c5
MEIFMTLTSVLPRYCVIGLLLLGAMAVTPALAADPRCPSQGWNEQRRIEFWYTTQGSRLMERKAFEELMTEDGKIKFSSPENLTKFKFLEAKQFVRDWATKPPKEELPMIGFARDPGEKGVEWVGLTCAACHTAAIQLGKDGPICLVEGGPTMADFESFIKALDKAVGKALPGATSASTPALKYTQTLLKSYLEPAWKTEYGYGRVDALGQIHNRLFKPKDNAKAKTPADAPVSYPHLWGTPSLSHVQWTAVASNEGDLGPLGRNVGEALGVFGQLDILKRPSLTTLPSHSSIHVANLRNLENWVKVLEAPAWPVQFGEVDAAIAESGKEVYQKHCIVCHAIAEKPTDEKVLIPVSRHKLETTTKKEVGVDAASPPTGAAEWKKWAKALEASPIGTDPHLANQSRERAEQKSVLENHLLENTDKLDVLELGPKLAKKFSPGTKSSLLLVKAVGLTINGKEQALFKPLTVFEAADQLGRAWLQDVDPQYKARPLNGIWATAPYLHNGSVPTLWDLLNPRWEKAEPIPDASKGDFRPQSFEVGCRQYDPERLGFVTSCPGESTFTFETKGVKGNSNQGHLWGTKLSPEDKRALLEYLKKL